jgi:DNA-binding transcriptional LysR family regulator
MVTLALLPRFLDAALLPGWSTRLRFRTEAPTRLIESLQAGEIDIALAPAELYVSDDALVQKRAFTDTVGIYAGRQHPLARKRNVEIAELGRYDWLGTGSLSRFRGTTAEILETIGAPGIRTAIEFTGNVATPIELLRTGKWLGLIPDFLGRFVPGADDLVRLGVQKPLPSRDVAFWFRRDMAERPQLVRFCTLFSDFVKQLPEHGPASANRRRASASAKPSRC